MNLSNATEVCNNMLSVCNAAFANSTYCSLARETMDGVPPALQSAVCLTGYVGSKVVDNWLWTFYSVGHYGGFGGQAAWVLLSGAVVKAAFERVFSGRKTEVTSETKVVNANEDALKQLLQNQRTVGS